MSNSIDDGRNCAVYRSNDPIKNFKIRVKIERLTSNVLLSSLSRLKIEEELSHLLNNNGQQIEKSKPSKTERAQAANEANRSEYEEVVISWQEKLFSRFEFETYGRDIGPCKTATEQKYFDEIQKMKANRKQPGRIFTYIENDAYCFERDFDYFMTDSPNEQPSQLALGINAIHKRRSIRHNQDYFSKTDIINRKPTSDELRINHVASLPYETMCIMADLSDITQTVTSRQSPNEHVLCRIYIYSNGTIILEPDFNNDKMVYLVEPKTFNNEVYQYYLEHASVSINMDDLIQEKRLFNEISLRHKVHLAEIIGNEFDIPPPTVLKLNIFGEIVSGKNFEYDDIYVYYCLDLADNWYVESSMILSGYTHTASATMSSKCDDIVYYSHPFEFELWYKPSVDSADYEFSRMPKIYFQVASLDTWGRHRTEGYTYMAIPSYPGFYDEHLSCWRPRGTSTLDEVRQFFIGSSIELEDITYVSIPKLFASEKDKKPLSRFGFQTVSTGILNIRLNVVFQSESITMEYRKQHSTSTVNRFGFDTFMSNINTVLDEFEKAKKRALEVRQSTFQTLKPNTAAFE